MNIASPTVRDITRKLEQFQTKAKIYVTIVNTLIVSVYDYDQSFVKIQL